MERVSTHKTKSIFERADISDQSLGNVDIIQPAKLEVKESPVKYVVPPDIDIIGVNAPKYDCCVQKIVDEMGRYIADYKMQFILGNDNSPPDIVGYFPKYVLYFRSGTIPNTPEGILGNLNSFIPYYKGLGMKVYYYLDDYLITMNNRAPLRLMENCDGVIVSTNALRDAIEAEKITVPISVMKTHIDLPTIDMMPPIDVVRDPKKFNILFSSQGRIGIQVFHEVVQKMNETPDKYKNVHLVSLSHQVAQVRSIINNCRFMKKTYLEWLPIDMYYRLAKGMDLIIAPASVGDLDYMMERPLQDIWLHCKSAHKYTLAGAARIPIISSPLRDYEEAIIHGETGFIARTADEWLEYIDLLMNDKDVYEKISHNIREDVVKNWSIYNRVEQLTTLLKGKEEKIEAPSVILNKNPRVLTHVAVHNGMPYIKEALESATSQSYKNHVVVVSDNCSDDGTVEFIEENYPEVKIHKWPIYHEIANPGLRKALEENDCDYWTGLGADDKLCPNYWETLLPYFHSKNIGIVRVGCYQFTKEMPEGSWWKPDPWLNPLDILVKNKVFITSPQSRKAWETIEKSEWGGWDPKCFFGDWDMWIQVILSGYRWATCKTPMFWYRRHASAWSFNYDYTVTGLPYTYMRHKWMKELVKYGITKTTMATTQMIEEAKKAAGLDKFDPKETVPCKS